MDLPGQTPPPPFVPLPSETFRVPEPEPPRRQANTTVVIVACSVLALAAMAFVGLPLLKKVRTASEKGRVMADLGAGKNDPYSRTRRDYASDPPRFQVKFARDLENALRQSAPDGDFDVDERAVVDDTGPALRMMVAYRGAVVEPDGRRVALKGHLRQYIHPYGMVTLESACYTDFSLCVRYDGLVAAADQAIMAHIGEGDLEKILPAEAECEKKQFDMAAQARFVAVCTFDNDVVLTFQRLGLGAANLELIHRSMDPGDRPRPQPEP